MNILPQVNGENGTGLPSPMGEGINLQFAFNVRTFSDRLLHVEIIADSLPSASHVKPERELTNGDAIQVKTVHVNSAILAACSPFFYKLFTNGTRETTERDVSLRINASEEKAFMDLLKCMYSNTLRATTTADLLNVLMVADKFEVTSCVKYCIELLQKKPMSLRSAISYTELPSNVSMDKALISLKETAKQYLLETLRDLVNSQEKVKELSLIDLKAMLGVDGLKVESEDQIFDLIVKWGRACFPNVKERQPILTNHLARFIYFPFMSPHKLEDLLVSDDFIKVRMSNLILKALHLSAGYPYGQEILLPPTTSHAIAIRRSYKYYPIKVVHIESPCRPRCFVYLYLRRDEVESLYPCQRRHSQSFLLGRRWFSLKVACDLEHQEFGLYLRMLKDSETCTLDYEFTVMKTTTSSKEFQSAFKKTNSSFNPGAYWGKLKLFGVPWFDFIGDRSQYFINGVLHLRAEITIES